jgi:hypothetical protein
LAVIARGARRVAAENSPCRPELERRARSLLDFEWAEKNRRSPASGPIKRILS